MKLSNKKRNYRRKCRKYADLMRLNTAPVIVIVIVSKYSEYNVGYEIQRDITEI